MITEEPTQEPTPSHLDTAEVHVKMISSSLSPHHRVEHAMREIIAHLREQEEKTL